MHLLGEIKIDQMGRIHISSYKTSQTPIWILQIDAVIAKDGTN